MHPKNKLILILIVIAALGLGYDHYRNGRRLMSITSTPTLMQFAPSASTTEQSATSATATATVPKPTEKAVPEKPATRHTETVGVIIPLSGPQAVYGQGIKEGLDLAAKGVNDTETFGIRIKLVYEDTRSDVKNAPAAARKLISTDHAVALITGTSPVSLAVAPIAEETHTVLFTMASLATKLNSAGAYVFKNDDVSSKIGMALADEARKRGFASAGTLFATYNDAVVEYNEAFAKAFAEKGGTVTGSEGFTQDATDFRTQIQKLIAAGPATIAVMGLQRDCAIAVRQIRELGYGNQLFGYTCFDDPGTLAAAGNAAEGIIMNGYNGTPTPLFSGLVKKAYGHEPLRWSAEAFDGMKLLAIAISRSYDREHPVSPTTLKDTLSSVNGYSGEAGHAEFDKDGNASRESYVKTVKDGKIELVK